MWNLRVTKCVKHINDVKKFNISRRNKVEHEYLEFNLNTKVKHFRVVFKYWTLESAQSNFSPWTQH